MLSTKSNYFRQDNDGTPRLLGAYKANTKYVACGVSSILCLCSIKGEELPTTITKYVSDEDYVMMMLYNPKNRNQIITSSGIQFKDFDCIQEYKMVYPWVTKTLFNIDIKYHDAKTTDNLWQAIVSEITKGNPVVTSGKFRYGGHYVCFVGYDDITDELIYNDPFPLNYEDKVGYARRISKAEFKNKVFKGRTDYLS